MSADASPASICAVVLNYNYGHFLSDAIDSVLAQTTPFEQVIVVNDGSTDDSLNVISAYQDSLTLLNLPNGGQLAAAFKALDVVHTEYVYFLDADDYASPDLVRSVKPLLRTGPVKVQFQLLTVDEAGDWLGSSFPFFPPDYDAATMRLDNESMGFYVSPPTSANCFRADVLRKLDRSQLHPRDYIDGTPNLICPYLGAIVSIRKPLAAYRVHRSNWSGYNRPPEEILKRDDAVRRRRWQEALQLIPTIRVPDDERTYLCAESAYVQRLLDSEGPWWPAPLSYIHRLHRSNLKPRSKALLTVWSLVVAMAPRRKRLALVAARRSPLNRATWLRKAVALILRGNATAVAPFPNPRRTKLSQGEKLT